MARTAEHRTRHRPWAVMLPLAGAVLIALYAVLSTVFYSAYLIAGRHLLMGPSLDGRLTGASLPQVNSGSVPPMDTAYLVDLDLWLRWLCAAPTLIFAVILAFATILTVVAMRRLTVGAARAALAKPWKILAAVLILGGLAQGLVDTAAVQTLRERYHPFVGFDSALATAAFAMPWPTLAFGLLAAAIAAAITAHSPQHERESSR